MNLVRTRDLVVAALLGALTFIINSSAAAAPTPDDSVKTRIGELKFERGFPTEETKRKVFDEIDYQRAVQAYLWAYPAVSFQSILMAGEKDFGRLMGEGMRRAGGRADSAVVSRFIKERFSK